MVWESASVWQLHYTLYFIFAMHLRPQIAKATRVTRRAERKGTERKPGYRRDTTHLDSEDDYRASSRNASHCQQKQSYSGLRSPGGSYSTYLWFKPFFFNRRLVSSGGRARVCRAGGRAFKPRPDQHSGSLNIWEESAAFVITSANG